MNDKCGNTPLNYSDLIPGICKLLALVLQLPWTKPFSHQYHIKKVIPTSFASMFFLYKYQIDAIILLQFGLIPWIPFWMINFLVVIYSWIYNSRVNFDQVSLHDYMSGILKLFKPLVKSSLRTGDFHVLSWSINNRLRWSSIIVILLNYMASLIIVVVSLFQFWFTSELFFFLYS